MSGEDQVKEKVGKTLLYRGLMRPVAVGSGKRRLEERLARSWVCVSRRALLDLDRFRLNQPET
jgi:hypothetical protein